MTTFLSLSILDYMVRHNKKFNIPKYISVEALQHVPIGLVVYIY